LLKHRVIPVLLYRDGMMVKGERFNSWRSVGSPMQAVQVYDMREVDELIVLDIGATPAKRGPDFGKINELTGSCYMPLTVGGGVRSLADIRRLLQSGADKVSINTAALGNPELIDQAAQKFGAQCVTVSIDVGFRDGVPEVMSHCGKVFAGRDPVEWALEAESRGAGEILLGSVERDGTMAGYDLALIEQVSAQVGIPVVAVGGAGCGADMVCAIRAGAQAVAAAAMFHFTEETPATVKRHLHETGIAVRI
jgi:cyclase